MSDLAPQRRGVLTENFKRFLFPHHSLLRCALLKSQRAVHRWSGIANRIYWVSCLRSARERTQIYMWRMLSVKVGFTCLQLPPLHYLYCETIATLHDIIRFLRKDDSPERKVFLQLTTWNIMRKDVIPLLLVSHTDAQISILTSKRLRGWFWLILISVFKNLLVKLLVFLTLPPERKCQNFFEQVRALHSNLVSIIQHSEILSIALLFLSNALQKMEDGRISENDYDGKMVQLVMTLFRNVLLVAELSQNVIENSQELQVYTAMHFSHIDKPPLIDSSSNRTLRAQFYGLFIDYDPGNSSFLF